MITDRSRARWAAAFAAAALAPLPAAPQSPSIVPRLADIAAFEESSLGALVSRFTSDLGAFERKWQDMPYSAARQARMGEFLAGWATALDGLEVGRGDIDASIDHVLLTSELRYRRELLPPARRAHSPRRHRCCPLRRDILDLLAIRRFMKPVDGEAVAGQLAALAVAAGEAERVLPNGVAAGGAGWGEDGQPAPTPVAGLRAVRVLQSYRSTLGSWYRHYAGYDPLFTWWAKQPFEEADDALDRYLSALRTKVVGWPEGGEEPIVGDPIGADGMAADLAREMIPYTPEELISIANREFAWCEERMLEASRELGFGEDWKAALEHVKTLHADPGGQPEVVMRLAPGGPGLHRGAGYADDPAASEGSLAAGDDVTGAPAGGTVLSGRRSNPGRLPDGRDDARREAHEHAREQCPLLARDGAPRAHPRAPPAGVHERALQFAPAALPHAILDRGLGALLGDAAMGPGVRDDAGGPGGHALLANALGRADHLLAELPPGADDAGRGHHLPGRPGGPRTCQRHSRGPPVLQRGAIRRSTKPRTCWGDCRFGRCTGSWLAAAA